MKIETLDLDEVKALDMLDQAEVCQREGIKFTFHKAETEQGTYTVMFSEFSVGICANGDTTWYEDLDTIEPAVYRYEGIDVHSVELDTFTDIAKQGIAYIEQVSIESNTNKRLIVVRVCDDYDSNELRFEFDGRKTLTHIQVYAAKQHRSIREIELRGCYSPKDVLKWASNLVNDIYI
jgi:hypothetical protein